MPGPSSSIKAPRSLLKARGIHPRKSMGQNFLKDPGTAASIVQRAGLGPDDTALEIGAGLGALTFPLAEKVKHVFAVESDKKIAAILRDELAASGIGNVTVIEEDILLCDLQALSKKARAHFKVAGNLPYHISSPVLLHLVHSREVIEAAYLMFQKEVADRLAAGPGSKTYGRLSVLVQYCAEIHPLVSVPAKAFYPRPKVDSQIVGIEFRAPLFPARDERLLVQVVRGAFGKRRKMLRNALLASGLGYGPETVSEALDLAGIDGKRRAETLSVEEFVRLANVFYEHKRSDQ